MELLLPFALWGLIVLCAPIGIWNAKSRLTQLEEEVRRLRHKLEQYSAPANTARAAKPTLSTPPLTVSATSRAQDALKNIITAPAVVPSQNPAPAPATAPIQVTAPVFVPAAINTPAPAPLPKPTATYLQASKPDRSAPVRYLETDAPKRVYAPEPLLPDWLTNALTGGRLFVTLGLLLLFIGVAMLLKYVSHYIEVPIEVRFIGVALGALGMIAFGKRQISARRDFGLYLQGGGLGILFLTVFTAFKFYSLLSPATAFVLLALIGAATLALSIASDALPLSLLAVTGGFLAPILTSTGQGSYIALFSYYLLLNLVILGIACVKPWRMLTTVGFGFTFVIGLLWGGQYYVPEFYPVVQAFLITYFLLYISIGILFAARSGTDIKNPVDASAIFGTPLIGFGLQLALVKEFPHGAAISALTLSGFYGALFIVFRQNERNGLAFLARIFLGLCGLFATIAIPFSFSAQSTAPLWAIEGTALLWMLSRGEHKLYGYAGILLLALSDFLMIGSAFNTPNFHAYYALCILMALAHLTASWFLSISRERLDGMDSLDALCSLAGLAWWVVPGLKEAGDTLAPSAPYMSWLLFFTVSSCMAQLAYRRFAVLFLDRPIAFVLPAIIFCAVLQACTATGIYHPTEGYGVVALPLAFAVHYAWLRQARQPQSWQHTLPYIAFFVLAGFELGYWLYSVRPTQVMRACGLILAATAGIGLLASPQKDHFWPLSALEGPRLAAVALWLSALMSVLCIYSFTQPATVTGYIPLFNIVEISELAGILSISALLRRGSLPQDARRLGFWLIGVLGFGFINSVALRMASHTLGVIYFSDEMFARPQVQTLLTILWTLMAMAAMITSSQLRMRPVWTSGAVLLAVVVLKLFCLDLADIGTLSRIISFMGVGFLTLVLGYIAPMPPKAAGG